MFNEYPYRNLTDLNLDWILKQIKDLSTNLEDFVKLNTVKYADPIDWNISSQYEANTVVVNELTGVAYLSTKPVPAGVDVTNTDYWTPIFTLDFVNLNKNITMRNDGNNNNATFASETGDWLIVGGQLYKVIQDIGLHTAYVVGYNIEIYSVDLFIKDYIQNILAMLGDLAELDTTDKSNIVNAINEVLTTLSDTVGDLADLDTTDKSNIVKAINEVLTTLSDTVGDLADLNTTDKSNIVKAINEVLTTLSNTVGDLADLDTTDKDSIVDAINEVKSDVDNITNLTKIDNVAALTAFDADSNSYVNTLGYYEAGDGGGATYYIDNNAAGLGDITLDNGLIAHLVHDASIFNVKQFGAYGDGTHLDDAIINSVIDAAIQNANSFVYLPAGVYRLAISLVSLRSTVADGQTFKDLNGLTLYGDGDETILYGENPTSIFDIIQLNQTLNVTIKDLKLYEVGTPVDHGANGVSITNGGQNITLENITVDNLPYYVGGGYIDGGKGFTIQWSITPDRPITNITIKNCRVKRSPIGFELDVFDTATILNNCIIDGCEFNVSYSGVIVSSNTASPKSSVLFINSTINTTQRGIDIARGAGFIANNISIFQNKAITNILSGDSLVSAIQLYSNCEACHFSNITIRFTNGVRGIYYTGTGGAENCSFSNILSTGTYTGAFIDHAADATMPKYQSYFNILAYDVTYIINSTITDDGSLKNDVIGMNNYNIFNRQLRTKTAVLHTLGSYGSIAIPIYDAVGGLIGYIPIYS